MLCPLSSFLFVRELLSVPFHMVDFLAACSKSFLIPSFVISSGILLTSALTFLWRVIRLCSNLGVFFPVTLCVVFNELVIVNWLTVYFEGLEFQLCSLSLIWGSNDSCFTFVCLCRHLIIAQRFFPTF